MTRNGYDSLAKLFDLTAATRAPRKHALEEAKAYLFSQKKDFIGFQANQDLDYRDELGDFLNLQINNLGDPYSDNPSFRVESRFAERAVVDYYAKLWNAPSHKEGHGETAWGYVLSMGSTEGNLLALWEARDYLRGEPLRLTRKNAASWRHRSPTGSPALGWDHVVAFFSGDTHYSIRRALDIIDVPTYAEVGDERYPDRCPITPDGKWPASVPSRGKDHPYATGDIDVDALEKLVEFFARRGHRILIVLNVGTTFKGACDDVQAIATKLTPIFEETGLENVEPSTQPSRRGYWIHVDGALGATYLPFLEKARQALGRTDEVPIFDFRLPAVHSIVASGHKWPGAPWPCGVYMTLQKYQIEPPSVVSYTGSPDTTLAGSRNGLSALVLWSRLSRMTENEEIDLVMTAMRNAELFHAELRELDAKKGGVLSPARSTNSLTVRFTAPKSEEILRKYSLPSAEVQGIRYAHAYVMPHVTEDLIRQFIRDLAKEKWASPGKNTPRQRRASKGGSR